MTLQELMHSATLELRAAGAEIPGQTAKWLWEHVSGMSPLEVILSQQQPVDSGLEQAFMALVARRAKREPLQYILAEAEFAGLKLYVDARVLIPRPETELLVTLAYREIERRHQADPRRPVTVVDLGTGSGAIIVALAGRLPEEKWPNVQLLATDLSEDTLAVAMINARRHGVLERVVFYNGDGLAALPDGAAAVDMLVANPPYIPLGEKPGLQPEVREFEPELALYGGTDGLDAYRTIADSAKRFLAQDATLYFEVGHDQAGRVRQLFHGAKTQSYFDAQGFERVVEIHLI